MSDDQFDLPDLGDLTSQIEEAMNEAQKAMEEIPDIKGLGDVMGSLSSLMENIPDQMGDLPEAITGFGEAHETNAETLIGEPDWCLEADIKVGEILHVTVAAEFDLAKLKQTWDSTQGAGFEEIVGDVVADAEMDLENGMFSQIMGQLKQGRGAARVTSIDVLACRIQGAPGNAVEKLRLSPEANIPLVVNQAGIGFEFAPMLTIQNRWEHANIPTSSPMAEEIVVPMSIFEEGSGEIFQFKPGNQEIKLTIGLEFNPLT